MKPIKKVKALKELVLLNKDRLVRKLLLANQKLLSKNSQINKCNSDLINAHKKLAFQHHENNVRESELLAANKKLIFKTQERQIKTAELNIANRELKESKEQLKEYLTELMFLTSHKVRQPIANILGFSKILDQTTSSPEELKLSLSCIKESVITLDVYTRELTEFISKLSKQENSSLL